MINGFEHITHDLTEYEKETLLPLFVKGLSKKIGSKNAVTNKHMVKALKEKGFVVSDARVRKIINVIRNHDLIPGLVATSSGYYVATSIEELEKYCESLGQRGREIFRVKASIERHIQQLKRAG